MIELIILFLGGVVLGFGWRDIKDNIDELWEHMYDVTPQRKPGVTLGAYRHLDEVNPAPSEPKARGHVVTPKTPQKMQWDSDNELREKNEKFHVGPK